MRRCILYMSRRASLRDPGRRQGSMRLLPALVFGILPCLASAQVAITGRVVDETGAGVDGARIELRGADDRAIAASSDRAGNFKLTLAAPGEYRIRAERLGFYLFEGKPRQFEPGPSELTVTLNHLQEFSDRIDVV